MRFYIDRRHDGGNAFLLLFGVILTIFGGIATIAQLERKRGYRRRRRRKKV